MDERISRKPSIYLIDSCNFLRSFWGERFENEDEAAVAFINWLEDGSLCSELAESEFRAVFDGSFRGPRPTVRGNVYIRFSEGSSADELLLEQSLYLTQAGKRPIIVTGDGGLIQQARADGLKSMSCAKFQGIIDKALAGTKPGW